MFLALKTPKEVEFKGSQSFLNDAGKYIKDKLFTSFWEGLKKKKDVGTNFCRKNLGMGLVFEGES